MTAIVASLMALLFAVHAALSCYVILRPESALALSVKFQRTKGPFGTVMQRLAGVQPYRWLLSGHSWDEVALWSPAEFRSAPRLMTTTRVMGWLSLGVNIFIVGVSAALAVFA